MNPTHDFTFHFFDKLLQKLFVRKDFVEAVSDTEDREERPVH
jgi:hypothetical protein